MAAAALEGALAGSNARQRMAELRLPPYSPPFAVWLLIGLGYYAICFVVLRHLLAAAWSPSVVTALALLLVVLLTNGLWNVFFFRWRDLRASFIAFIPYAVVVAALAFSLCGAFPFGAALFMGYCIYLLYATWWGYRLWVLNTQEADQPVS